MGKQSIPPAESLVSSVSPLQARGNGGDKGSANHPSGEQDLQLAERQVPILTPGMPVLHNTLRGQIEQPAQGIIASKAGRVLGDLPELAIEALDDIGRVYDLPDLGRVFIKRPNFPPSSSRRRGTVSSTSPRTGAGRPPPLPGSRRCKFFSGRPLPV